MNELKPWQQKLQEQSAAMTSRELLDEVIDLAKGDDWDGGWTSHGYNEYLFMYELLVKRLGLDKEG